VSPARLTILAALAAAGCGSVAEAQRDRDCSDFSSQHAAQRFYDAHPGDPDRLDGDGNGVACDSLATNARPAALSRSARVVSVVDGDTIKVRVDGHRETVRLIGIDTPESKRPNTPVECGAKNAAAAMKRLVAGRSVTLRRDPSQDAVDRYGRTLAYVDLGGGRDAGETMIRSGWATVYVYGDVPFVRVRAYRSAAAAAKRGGLGVDGACGGDFHRAR
jgi:micrococcal nuclease